MAASSGPGLGHDDTAAAAFAMASSVGGGGGADVEVSASFGGADFVAVSPEAVLPPTGGRGGGGRGASHRVVKRGNIIVDRGVGGGMVWDLGFCQNDRHVACLCCLCLVFVGRLGPSVSNVCHSFHK